MRSSSPGPDPAAAQLFAGPVDAWPPSPRTAAGLCLLVTLVETTARVRAEE